MYQNRKILICTGGTGGHVIPAINFANYLIEQGYECSLILDKRGNKYAKKFKGKISIISSSHLSGNIFFKIKSIINLMIGFYQSFYFIIKLRPKNCISFGSYATFMPLLIILILKLFTKVDLYIHEQNSIIGKANLFFLPYTKYIFTNFEFINNLDEKFFYKKFYVGLPLGRKLNLDFSKIIKPNEKKIIFVYGGSQGAVNVIKNFLLMLNTLNYKHIASIKLIIQSPKEFFYTLKQLLKNFKIDYEINDFFKNINEILEITNIAITRAGAGTINDLIRYRIPSIIFPLPHSIYNHQFFNAKYLADKNGAILMDEVNFNLDHNSVIFKELITNIEKQKLMKKSLEQITIPEANQIMIKKILYENKK